MNEYSGEEEQEQDDFDTTDRAGGHTDTEMEMDMVGEVSPDEEYYGDEDEAGDDDDCGDEDEDDDIISRSPTFFDDEEEEEEDDELEVWEEGDEESHLPSDAPPIADAAGEWTNMTPLVNARYRFTYATINGRFYVFGGRGKKGGPHDKEKLNSMEVFTPAVGQFGSWIDSIPPMESRISGASAAVVVLHNDESNHESDTNENSDVDVNIYIIGGAQDTHKHSRSVHKFNILTNAFTKITPMKKFRRHHTSVSIGSIIYVIGGYECKNNELYDTQTDTWSYMPPLICHRYLCAAVAVGKKIYIIGGMSVENNNTNTSTSPSRHHSRHRRNGVDYDYDRYLNSIEIYDTETETWTLSNAKMNNRRAGCCAVVTCTDGGSVGSGGSTSTSTITVVGGRDEKQDVLAIEEYDIEKDEWRPSSTYRSLGHSRSRSSSRSSSTGCGLLVWETRVQFGLTSAQG